MFKSVGHVTMDQLLWRQEQNKYSILPFLSGILAKVMGKVINIKLWWKVPYQYSLVGVMAGPSLNPKPAVNSTDYRGMVAESRF